ncbi:copper resistance protein B [Achromobacter piechaudii]|uniref:Copper resistance protein B n=1 Tax=Achromobacter piechaudii TaxID=72556 RepID=A0ABM8KQZ2_9BURK|nr:copper resistance protein B [Achromobacter piechaudii]CAB3654906.1 Copper resistance protein B [Achromobacter piechaudii]CAB3817063.1 Copper resistance protein B [Achromobacter piechaudii]CAB3945923.1 Copper resistance protein B [Achromobacter piechaudii]
MKANFRLLRLCALTMMLAAAGAHAQSVGADHGTMDHSSMDHSGMGHGAAQAPAPAVTAPANRDDAHMDHAGAPPTSKALPGHSPSAPPDSPPVGSLPSSDGAAERGYDSYGIHPHMMDNAPAWQVLFDKFGVSRNRDGQNALQWDGRYWYGTATDRLLLKSEGERESGGGSQGKVEAFWSHAVSPFWDLQLGARRDIGTGPKRNWAAIGIEGVLPYNVELETTAYVGASGRTALALKAEYDLLLTQRLIFTPELEASLYGKSDPARGVGSGLSSGSLSLRLRYEVTREFAPYIGVSFDRKFGQTARYASDAGDSRSQTALIAGVRFWF